MALVLLGDGSGRKIDTMFDAAGNSRAGLAIGTVDHPSATEDLSWKGIATHMQGAVVAANDGLAVAAGISGAVGTGVATPFLVDSTGRLITVPAASAGNTSNAGTLAITAGGTRQQLFAANVSRKWLFIQNVAAEDVWINFGANATAASPSIKLGPGDSMEFNGSFVPSQAVDWIAATTGTTITAKEG